ncbi:quinone oxidoreductase family protein [Saliterribacillus persicus]|uniref:Zinc-binding alcohol dehydrogenase/oxidoreductase n=1 Tax=Saliterribacillus persicus TaxID=930114 RepID=A0A368XXU6_9BACI|nr:zinc-binding dehydrogenase [Saliterribacillus persicus]RCW71858.1 zinc-binding alcohol dehydrogenase/oxidoreductase [Saliterribacillus persicus]
MQAFVLEGKELKNRIMEEPELEAHDVKIRVKSSGLNHRDLNIPTRRKFSKEPLILGSDGAGVIIEVGEKVSEYSVGDEVIIDPFTGWKENTPSPPDEFEILGMPSHGTFSEIFVANEENVSKKPLHLDWNEAGVIALAGLTAYRAVVTKANIRKNDTIFIPGAGGGVNMLAIKFASALGAKVITSSRSNEKRELAKKIGASQAISTHGDWKEELKHERIDVVIEGIGGDTFLRSLDVLKKGGTIVTYGSSTADTFQFDLRAFFYGQYKMFGSTMGSKEELTQMLAFIKEYNIKPEIGAVFPLKEARHAFEYLKESKQFGKVVLTNS